MSEKTKTATPKKAKKQGPIRWEAVIPFAIIVVLIGVYTKFFFDAHMRLLLEWTGYQVVGAEVNIRNFETSLTKGSIRVQGIEITDSQKPTHNSIGIGDIRFGVVWDGLLRARFIVEEMAVEQIEIGTPRKSPGKVKPPDPEKPASNEPSAVEKEANKLKNEALDKAQSEYGDNVLGDIAALLSGTSAEGQVQNIENSLASKAMLQKFDQEFKAKQASWRVRIDGLPKGPEIQALGDRLSKIKTSNFKTPQELEQSLKELDAVVKEADAKVKNVQGTSTDLGKELKAVEADLKAIDQQVKSDIKDLEARFKIPKLDAKSISKSLFMRYMDPYMAKFNQYKAMADKYMPPKFKKKGADKQDEVIQPHPRDNGVTYEFAKPNGYPLFWVKKVSISSQAGATPASGNIAGRITDITSNQRMINKATVLEVKGDFPAQQLTGLNTKITLDNRPEDSIVTFLTSVQQYALAEKRLIEGEDGVLGFKKASGSLDLKGTLKGLRNLDFDLNNNFSEIEYEIAAKNETVQQIFKEIFAGIPLVNLSAGGGGELPRFDFDIRSNLGTEIEKGFQAQLQKKIAEARAKLEAFVTEQVGAEKARIEGEVNKIKAQVEGEVKKIQDQLNAEKAKGEGKANAAKKDAENQAKKQIEAEAKKILGNDADKKMEELKKKLGW